MEDKITKSIVFFVLIFVIVISMLGTWEIITLDDNTGSNENTRFQESKTGTGYISIDINSNKNSEKNE